MLPLDFFDSDNLSDTDKKVIKYVNNTVKEIIGCLIDFLQNDTGFNSEDFLPYNNIKFLLICQFILLILITFSKKECCMCNILI